MADFSNLKDNDQARPFPAPKAGNPSDSENNPVRDYDDALAGSEDTALPEAKRAGYGFSEARGGANSPMGGHNLNDRNQYTIRMPRGSSL